ncbi:MAG TPA: glycosyl transferase, partial [Clostridia bacterium]|nr:glycosyl transferase [Clostridia bacterium]
LPYIVAEYIRVIGDEGILDEKTPFLENLPLEKGKHVRYEVANHTQYAESIYEHCRRAIESALVFGEHGLPLMGTGDWNDAMDSVGDEGKGESVWLGWFLYDVLVKMADLAQKRGDAALVGRYSSLAGQLRENIEKHAWDGSWYIRAFDDKGRKLGSSANLEECRIDAVSQAWASLSDAANIARVNEALESAKMLLYNKESATFSLLTPPFKGAEFEPGYIAAYLPGVRENGGQYTHAVVWMIMALAKQNKNDDAWELLDCVNPVMHTLSEQLVMRYKTEPYAIPADIYTVPPNEGRGGWTWYTGSAAWLYKCVLESLIGFKLRGDTLSFEPHLPSNCNGVEIDYRYKDSTLYKITIYNAGANKVKAVYLDGKQAENNIKLVDDHVEHRVKVMLEAKQV